METMKKSIFIGALLLILVGIAILQKGLPGSSELGPGDPAPAFTLETIDGQKYAYSHAKGKPAIISFFATWCDPCHKEAPLLVEWHRKYGSQVEFVFVNWTKRDDVKSAQFFAKDYGIRFPVVMDQQDRVSNQFQIKVIPTTYFINRDGKIERIVKGVRPADTEAWLRAQVK
jgi:cytochrome c biogenesis protein CcmG/thiol:disulfide interchange protein DsbE